MNIKVAIAAIAFGTGFAAMHTPPAAASEPVLLAPATQWNLDYAENKCRLMRFFGGTEAKDRVVLMAEQYSPSAAVELMIAGTTLRGLNERRGMTLQFGPAFPALDSDIQVGEFGESSPALLFGEVVPGFIPENGAVHSEPTSSRDIPAPAMSLTPKSSLSTAEGAKIEWIELVQGKRAYRLQTGAMDKVFAAMNACNDNLLASWGVDTGTYAGVAVQPIVLNFPEVARQVAKNYPQSALRAGQMAKRRVRLLIDETGTATDCLIIDTTEADRFDDKVCDIFTQTAEIEPARDSGNRPVPSYLVQTIRYIIP